MEIERKFLVELASFRPVGVGQRIRQAYISDQDNVSVRVRQTDEAYSISVKSALDLTRRHEVEIRIEPGQAEVLFAHCIRSAIVDKRRFTEDAGSGLVWEIDVFEGDNAGLVVAEVELPAADYPIEKPGWIGEEVTEDPRYLNSELAKRPYCSW